MDHRLLLHVLLVTLSGVLAASAAADAGRNPAATRGNTANKAGGNSTGSNATTATTAIPVATLATAVSKTGCGSSKLCAAEPSQCDPSTGNGCFFISAKQNNGQKYDFELSGQSDGYIAAGLSTTNSVDGVHQAYICAKNNSVVNFFTATINNLQLTLTPLNASNVKGAINSNKIQCTFSADLPDTTTKAAGYSMSVSTGSYDPTSAALGKPAFKVQTNVVNLTDSNANITNLVKSTNAAYPITHQQSLMMPALLVTVTILAFTAL